MTSMEEEAAKGGEKASYAPVDIDGDYASTSVGHSSVPDGSFHRVAHQCWNNRRLVTIVFFLGFAMGAIVASTACLLLGDNDNKDHIDGGEDRGPVDSSSSSPPAIGGITAPPVSPPPPPPPPPLRPATAPPVPNKKNDDNNNNNNVNNDSNNPTSSSSTSSTQHSDLTELNSTVFLDCPYPSMHSYRDLSDNHDGGNGNDDVILLWLNMQSTGNYPAASVQLGPFDDRPVAHVSFARSAATTTPASSPSSSSSRPIVLLLQALEAVHWVIDVGESSTAAPVVVNLVRVIASGFHNQTVEIVTGGGAGVGGAPPQVETPLSGDNDNDKNLPEIEIFEFASSEPMPGTTLFYAFGNDLVKEFKEALEDYVGAPLYQYDFCFSASKIEYRGLP